MVVTAGMVDMAVGAAMAMMTPSPPVKTACNAIRNKARDIATDLSGAIFFGDMNMLNIKVVTWSLAIWTAFTFVFCVIYGLVTPASMHMTALLAQVLPGFVWLTAWGFLVGLTESFLYGAYAGLVYVPIYNFLHRKWAT